MTNKNLIDFLTKHKACEEGMLWIEKDNIQTFEDLWSKCQRSDWMLWLLDKLGYCNKKQLVLYACWCTRNTLLADGRKVWDLLTDERSRKAVEVAELFIDGKATQEEIELARSAARSAARFAARSAESAAWFAAESAAESAWFAARSAWFAAWLTARSVAESAAWLTARSAWFAVQLQQANELRKMISTPFKEIK